MVELMRPQLYWAVLGLVAAIVGVGAALSLGPLTGTVAAIVVALGFAFGKREIDVIWPPPEARQKGGVRRD